MKVKIYRDGNWHGIAVVAGFLALSPAVGGGAGAGSPQGKSSGDAPVVAELKVIETEPNPAQVYFSFKVSDPNGDLDLTSDTPIKAGVFCGEAGFAGTSFGKAEKYDKPSGLVHYRASFAPHRGEGACSFDLTVKDKAGNESVALKAKVAFSPPRYIAAADGPEALKPLTGRWKAMLMYTESGGRFTASWAEEIEVKPPDPNSIAFSIRPVASADPVFEAKLSYDAASSAYLLTVRNREKATVDKLKLTFVAGAGFSGDGTLTDSAGRSHPIRVAIAARGDGYEWTFKDPAGPEGNNIALGFSFVRRN